MQLADSLRGCGIGIVILGSIEPGSCQLQSTHAQMIMLFACCCSAEKFPGLACNMFVYCTGFWFSLKKLDQIYPSLEVPNRVCFIHLDKIAQLNSN